MLEERGYHRQSKYRRILGQKLIDGGEPLAYESIWTAMCFDVMALLYMLSPLLQLLTYTFLDQGVLLEVFFQLQSLVAFSDRRLSVQSALLWLLWQRLKVPTF